MAIKNFRMQKNCQKTSFLINESFNGTNSKEDVFAKIILSKLKGKSAKNMDFKNQNCYTKNDDNSQ